MNGSSSHGRITYGLECRVKQVGCFRVVETRHGPGTVLHRHDHEEASLNIVMRGGFVERIGSRELSSSRGMLVIKPAGVHHANKYLDALTLSILVHIQTDSILELGALARAFGETRSWQNEDSLALGRLLQDALQSPGAECLEAEERLIEALGNAASAKTPRIGFIVPAWLQRVRDRLAERATGSVSINEIARAEGVTPVSLAKAFRRAYGISASTFVRRIRVNHARVLLEERSKQLVDVALSAGFVDQAHFTRAFKRESALTPGQYRRLLHSRS